MNNKKTIYFLFQSSQAFEPSLEDLTSFQRKYKKDFKTRELYEGEELADEYRLVGWKHPRYSKIISFVIAFEENENLRIKYVFGEERDVIQTFFNILRKSQEYDVVTYNTRIILPFVSIRSKRNDLLTVPHNALKYNKGIKPYEVSCIDLQQYYDGFGAYKSSIKDIAEDLKLESSDIVEIEDEFNYYNLNDLEPLKKSAIQKIEVIANAYRILNGLSKLKTILVEEQVKDVVEEKPKDLFKEINMQKIVTPEIKEELKQIFSKKKLSKKNKEIAFELIKASLADIDQNFGGVKNQKQIDESINQLKEEFESN